ncbi:MAG TPA: hypothetical protein VHP33_24815 [Polyangiaceae bacterium]|nr:hypothetical protein [Polyangiaceae bacterium]
MFGEQPLSQLARELLARERGSSEDEALKSRAMARARAALPSERSSSVGLRRPNLGAGNDRPRRLARTLPLIAASLAAVGLALAGAGVYEWRAPQLDVAPREDVRPSAPTPRQLTVGGALPGVASSSPEEAPRAPAPRAENAPPTAANDGARALNMKQYAAELLLLEPARSSIARGDYPAALTAIDQHRREFPRSQLSEEREALRIRALWGLGQRPAALSAAKSFRKRYPRSSLLSWLQAQSAATP